MDATTSTGFHMMINTSLLNLGLFISDIAIPMYVLASGGTFVDIGWASACSFLLSGVGAVIFGNLGDNWGFGLIRFVVNSGIVVLYIVLVATANLSLILVVYVIRGLVMQNVWVSFAFYGKNQRPLDALWFISSTLTLMYCAQVIAPVSAGFLIVASSARVTLIITLIVFGIVFLQSGNFAKCRTALDDDSIASIQDSSAATRPSVPSADTYREEPLGPPEPESFLDLSIPRQFIILFLVFEAASCTIMTVILMTWFVPYAAFVLKGSVIIAAAQITLFSLTAALVSKFLPQMYATFSMSNANPCLNCLSFIHMSRAVIAVVAVLQILILEGMLASIASAGVVNTASVWVGMAFLGLFQGIMYVVPSALLAEYAPKESKYSSFVRAASAFFKRGCTAVGLFFVGLLLGSMNTVLFYVLEISLAFAPASIAIMYLCDCFEARADEQGAYETVPTAVAGDV